MTEDDRPGSAPGRSEGEAAQLALMPDLARARARDARRRQQSTAKSRKPVDPAAELPVARVLVDVPHAHLDRPFDYLVPEKHADDAVPGARVKVRFAGQDVDGFVLERVERSEHEGRLAPLRRVVSAEPVLAPEIVRLSATVAGRYAGTRSDVLRLAVPPRHATVEKAASPSEPDLSLDREQLIEAWAGTEAGGAFVRRLLEGEHPRAVWSTPPGADWPHALAAAAAATRLSGRGTVLCVPDHRDVARVDAALTALLGEGHHVVLTADAGPAARYRAFLALRRGAVRIALGTRAAAFAPVHDLGLVALWDDGDDLYADLHAPYPHTREVLLLRAHEQGAAALVAGHARTVEAQSLLDTGWAVELAAGRAALRARVPRVAITGASDVDLARDPMARQSRFPRAVFETVREALQRGPVLVQTPRHGYAAALACDRCRTPATCARCTGPLAVPASHRPPSCRWCGEEQPGWACRECGGRGLRAPVRGDQRTAEELGRAFPAVPVRTSSGDRVLDGVGSDPAIVVATPGAEPVAEGGYAGVVLLDTWLMLARPDLRTTEESLRRWFNAAALARPGDDGRVLAVGDPADPTLQALVRWDPAGFAQRELADRQSAHLPPASRLATLTGSAEAVTEALTMLSLPDTAEVLGPVPVEAGGPPARAAAEGPTPVRVVVRVPRAQASALSRALVQMQGVRDAKKLAPVRVQVDPVALG